MRETEAFPYMIMIKGSCAISCDSGVTRGKDSGFSNIVINEDGDGIKAIRFGKFCDKVHGNRGERGSVGERGNRMEGNGRTIR